MSRVSPLRFLLFDCLASVFWAGGYMALGYTFSGQFERLATYSSQPGTIGLVVLIAAAAAFIGFRLKRNHLRLIPVRARERSAAVEIKSQDAVISKRF